MRNEVIEKFTILDDGTVYIKTNKREYQRTLKKSVADEKYVMFKNSEYTIQDMKRYGLERL